MTHSRIKRLRKILLILGLLFVLVFGTIIGYFIGTAEDFPQEISADNPSSEEAATPSADDHIIVKFKEDTSNSDKEKIKNETDTKETKTIEEVDAQILDLPDNQNSHQAVMAFRNNYADQIEYAELDAKVEPLFVPNDVGYSKQWGLPKISAQTGWDITQGLDDVTIAVLDTGVNVDHPDLKNKLAPGWNVVDNNNDLTDLHGHGTMMMGIAGGQTNNNIGIAGLAVQPKIMMVRICNNADGWAYWSDMAEAIVYAANHNAKVISISFGGTSSSSAVRDAVNYAYSKGSFIAASAGNSGSTQLNYPAAFQHVVAVGATSANDQKAYFSNYGPWVDVTSPGVSIYSTDEDGGYAYVSGTSPATPFVAGLAALALSKKPTLNPDEIENYIKQNADDLGSQGKDDIYGFGRINAARTLSAVANQNFAPPQVGSISGKVTNANDGSPITGAKINVLQSGITRGSVSTISDGSYIVKNLPGGSYDIAVSATGYISTFKEGVGVQSGQTAENQSFALQSNNKNGFIKGRVYDYRGKLVPKALVMLTLVSSPRPEVQNIKKYVLTDGLGRFSFDGLPEGTYYLRSIYYARFAKIETKVYPESYTYAPLKLTKTQYWTLARTWLKRFFGR